MIECCAWEAEFRSTDVRSITTRIGPIRSDVAILTLMECWDDETVEECCAQ
jgi:hypothetical protein